MVLGEEAASYERGTPVGFSRVQHRSALKVVNEEPRLTEAELGCARGLT